jgi:hypothetical protein
MRVKRVVTNVAGKRISAAKRFYQGVLGLDLLMDLGWIATYGSDTKMSIQVSFTSQGGSGTEVPDISIEVDDVDEAYRRMKKAKFKIEYDITNEPSLGVYDVSTYAIPSESWSTSYLTSSVGRPTVECMREEVTSRASIPYLCLTTTLLPKQGCDRGLLPGHH